MHADYRVKANADKAYVNYIYAGNRAIGTYTINWIAASNTTSYDLKYFHLDGQGSIIAITNSVGAVVERLSYDAWGKRRNANGTDDLSNALVSASTDHGYTGHEHLDDMGLIHMNGRVYDPRTERFLQADPTIQSPGNLQSFNRYSYVMNNPFFYTDPSGFSWLGDRWHALTGTNWADSRDQYVKPIVAAVVAYYTGGLVSGSAWATCTATGATWGGVLAGAVGGAAFSGSLTAMYGGNLNDVATAAAGGAVAGAIGAGIGQFAGSGALGRTIDGGVNGYIQTGTTEGMLRGMAAGAIPQNLWMENQYMNSGAANIAIGVARDGLRGMVIADSRNGFYQGVLIGQRNNAIGHLVGIATTGSMPTFKDGAFIYKGSWWEGKGGMTVGNVISGSENSLSADVVDHERGHIGQTFLGALYPVAHALALTTSMLLTGDFTGRGAHSSYNPLECTSMFISPTESNCH